MEALHARRLVVLIFVPGEDVALHLMGDIDENVTIPLELESFEEVV